MQRYFLSRIGQSIAIIIGVLFLVFFMVRVTGDPAALMMSRNATQEDVEAFREKMGFNRPIYVQFADFITHAIRGDFGNSLRYRMPAMQLVLERIPATVELASVLARALGLIGQSVPNFWLALILIIIFAVNLQWFPSFGRDDWKSVVLPAVSLALFPMGQFVRLTRATVLDVRSQNYVRTAYSKGLSKRTVYFQHILRNVALSLISIIGIQFGYLLSGSIYIEFIFSWPGIGQMIAESVAGRDFPLIQAIAIFTSVVIVLINLLTDMAYVIIDPRIKYG
ncbi:MAG: ABC transporter permease [Anaerolineaceae bacterium 4572_78]|nr:MAG: ABC transporter permease [Anaerolineaceae bacterium 4572_78]